jgi:hypothetical protein
MRKLLWCCSAAGMLAAGGLFAAMYFACRCPDSTIGRFVYTAATVTFTLHPIRGLASLADSANRDATLSEDMGGSIEECIPADPQPIQPEQAAEKIVAAAVETLPPEPAAIVIPEDESSPRTEVAETPPSTIDITGFQGQETLDRTCPMVMPYCVDDDEPIPQPRMPYADAGKKQADGSEASEDEEFKAWMKLFDEGSKEKEAIEVEELPQPQEEPKSDSKCEEDIHRHEQYPGCPRVTCPYTGKSYPVRAPLKKRGKEESSEEPGGSKLPGAKESIPRTQGVDTMEYRPSDGGLNEYGRGPL